jgi:hypothetical protein
VLLTMRHDFTQNGSQETTLLNKISWLQIYFRLQELIEFLLLSVSKVWLFLFY